MNSCGCFVMPLFVGLYTHRRVGGQNKKSTSPRREGSRCVVVGGAGGGALTCLVCVLCLQIYTLFFFTHLLFSPFILLAFTWLVSGPDSPDRHHRVFTLEQRWRPCKVGAKGQRGSLGHVGWGGCPCHAVQWWRLLLSRFTFKPSRFYFLLLFFIGYNPSPWRTTSLLSLYTQKSILVLLRDRGDRC